MSKHDLFLRVLDLMTSPICKQDGFNWVIDSIDLLPEGPCAIFRCEWPKTSHDSFSCVSIRMENDKPVLRQETCTMGKYGTDATQAVMNRFQKALRVVLR